MGEPINDDTRHGGLLAMLVTKGLIRSPEVTVTSCIAWLSHRQGGASALDRLIRSSAGALRPGDNQRWETEVRAANGTRTDLECWWGNPPLPRVVVEAKLGASLTVRQMSDYISDLRCRLDDQVEPFDALVVVLAPAHRRFEAEQVMAQAAASDAARPMSGKSPVRLHTEVWDYDQVLGALHQQLGDDPDLEQLRLLVEECAALDVKPFTAAELREPSVSRQADLIAVLDRASVTVTSPGQRVLPSGRDADYQWRRYVETVPGGTTIALGIRKDADDTARDTSSAAWLRIHRDSHEAAQAGARVCASLHRAHTDSTGHTWSQLDVPTGVGGAAMVDALVGQLRFVISAIATKPKASEK